MSDDKEPNGFIDAMRFGGTEAEVEATMAAHLAPRDDTEAQQRAQEALAATGAVQPYPAVAPAVPVARVRALVALLYPEEMTPTAKRMIEQVCEAHE